MDQKITALLLGIIDKDSDVKKLKYYGLTYRQIGELIEANVENGNLNSEHESVVLTQKGKEYLEQNKNLIKEPDKSKWIEIDFKNKIKKINKEDVFLPSSKHLSFLK